MMTPQELELTNLITTLYAIEAYLSSDCYVEKMKSKPNLKSNLRKVAQQVKVY